MRIFGFLIIVGSSCVSEFASAESRGDAGSPGRYCNPLEVCIADPAVLWHDRTAFLTGTGLTRYVSRDLVNWELRGNYLDRRGTWLRGGVWACELAANSGRFYLYFSCRGRDSDNRCICVAVSDSPAGDFEPLAFPMWKDQFGWIDPHVFTDDDGQKYLFVTNDTKSRQGGRAQIYAAPLNDNMIQIEEPLTFLMEPSQPWEYKWQEGATVLKHEEIYYLMWSSRLFAGPRYSVGFATAPHPLGPWTKYRNNPVLKRTAQVSGPGHNGVVRSPDGAELLTVYHTHRTSAMGGERQLAMDRLRFEKDPGFPDKIVIDGPSHLPQRYPSGAAVSPTPTGRDEFDNPELDRSRWSAVWNERPGSWEISDGALRIFTTRGQVYQSNSSGNNIFLQMAPPGDWDIMTKVTFPCRDNFEYAFLTVWQDCNNYVMLKRVFAGEQKTEFAVELAENYRSVFLEDGFGDEVFLRITKRGTRYRGYISPDGDSWIQTGDGVEADLRCERVGPGACAPVSGARLEAEFEFFEVRPLP